MGLWYVLRRAIKIKRIEFNRRIYTWRQYSEAHGCSDEYVLRGNRAFLLSKLVLTRLQAGSVMGNGTWVNVGGNYGVTYGGLQAANQNGGGPYQDPDGRQSWVVLVHWIQVDNNLVPCSIRFVSLKYTVPSCLHVWIYRLLNPCEDNSCNWILSPSQTVQRWYPTL